VSCEETQKLFAELFKKIIFLLKKNKLDQNMEVCDNIEVEIDGQHFSFL